MGRLSRAKSRVRARRGLAESDHSDATVDLGPLGAWIGFHLRTAQAASFQAFARRAKGFATRPGRFATLMLIGRNPGISQTALSRANGRDKSSLTPVLTDLERGGFIVRQKTDHDRRTYQLTLTKAGKKLLRELTVHARQHDRVLDRLIGPRDRNRFLAMLRKISTGLS